ncbi:MAG: hypothetical protein HY459_03260 [Parcubacteria group bacterium]|nr:hypothetical protein [Parcubacteria group bacterium]
MPHPILGMNARNLLYLLPSNKERGIFMADHKLLMKERLSKAQVPTPRTLAVINNFYELATFPCSPLESFVVKPDAGLGGEGIMVIRKRVPLLTSRGWLTIDDQMVSEEELKDHIANILDGNFSLHEQPDIAFFEERVVRHPIFRPLTPFGVPDIRILVYNRVPVMAMLRLPTIRSRGRANLAQGAVGVGVDIVRGVTTYGMIEKPRITLLGRHPDTHKELKDIGIPLWHEIVSMALKAASVSGLGYVGVDVVIDRMRGPMVLELNARPGMGIQIANLTPLAERLARVRGLTVKGVKHALRVSQELFSDGMEAKESFGSANRPTIGIEEPITILGKDGTIHKVLARIDTGAALTSIDRELAAKLGYHDLLTLIDRFEIPHRVATRREARAFGKRFRKELRAHPDVRGTGIIYSSLGASYRVYIPLTLTIAGQRIETRASLIDRTDLTHHIIVGRHDLTSFLVDPAKKS